MIFKQSYWLLFPFIVADSSAVYVKFSLLPSLFLFFLNVDCHFWSLLVAAAAVTVTHKIYSCLHFFKAFTWPKREQDCSGSGTLLLPKCSLLSLVAKKRLPCAAIVDAVVKIIVLPAVCSDGTWGKLDELSWFKCFCFPLLHLTNSGLVLFLGKPTVLLQGNIKNLVLPLVFFNLWMTISHQISIDHQV